MLTKKSIIKLEKKLFDKKYVLLSILILIFITTMCIAYFSKLNMHPDEQCHYLAVKYYETHNLPPKFDSEEITDTFSDYGESRLTELDPYYFIVGKYTSLVNLIVKNDVFVARSFNVILLLVLLSICYKLYKNRSYLFFPLLISSQCWYVFSYINNDAWAIFLNFIFVYELFYSNSFFNKYMESSSKKDYKYLFCTISFGILLYLLLTAKANFIVCTLLIALAYFIINYKKIFRKNYIINIIYILVIGLILFSLRIGIDFKINGLDRINNMENIRILRASEAYKPEYEQEITSEYFKLKERGTKLTEIVFNTRFYLYTLFSFIGLYGYMNLRLPYIIYLVVAIIYVILLYTIFKDKSKFRKYLSIILFSFGFIVVMGLSIYRSYTYDFQPQGRYLFPILPICSLFFIDKNQNSKLEKLVFIISTLLVFSYIIFAFFRLV